MKQPDHRLAVTLLAVQSAQFWGNHKTLYPALLYGRRRGFIEHHSIALTPMGDAWLRKYCHTMEKRGANHGKENRGVGAMGTTRSGIYDGRNHAGSPYHFGGWPVNRRATLEEMITAEATMRENPGVWVPLPTYGQPENSVKNQRHGKLTKFPPSEFVSQMINGVAMCKWVAVKPDDFWRRALTNSVHHDPRDAVVELVALRESLEQIPALVAVDELPTKDAVVDAVQSALRGEGVGDATAND